MKRILMPMLVVAAAVAGLILIWNASLFLFLDFYAFMLVPVLGTLYAVSAHGVRPAVASFSAALRPDAGEADLRDADVFLGLLGSSYAGFSVLGSIISLIDMFKNLADRTQLGPRLALVFISMEYAALLYLLIIIPYRNAIKKRLAALQTGLASPS
ncbi:MAG: hypothetical protein A2413_13660 [Treponema sp. RIFOXYC1_FULL_61_9]|nr:MAG: hypothetical protein A2413_13660 [Treponema sp. RIFOXYC1_FULL_61_9]